MKKKSEVVTIRIPPEMKSALDEIASGGDSTIAEIIRRLLDNELSILLRLVREDNHEDEYPNLEEYVESIVIPEEVKRFTEMMDSVKKKMQI